MQPAPWCPPRLPAPSPPQARGSWEASGLSSQCHAALPATSPKERRAQSRSVQTGCGAGSLDSGVVHTPYTKPCTHLHLNAGVFLQPLYSLGKVRAAAWDTGFMLIVGHYLQHNRSSSRGQREPHGHHTLQLPPVALENRATGNGGSQALPACPT